MAKKVVAIVGRPNVGKSTLFNVFAGEKISIIKDVPGVTRDRVYADCTWRGTTFQIIDTGGIEPESDDIILKQMRRQAMLAMDIADVIVFITDVKAGVTQSDLAVAEMLRKTKKPVILVCNKCDRVGKPPMELYEFYNLGLGDPIPISANGKLGIGELLDEIYYKFDNVENEIEDEEIDYSNKLYKEEDMIEYMVFDKGNTYESYYDGLIESEKEIIELLKSGYSYSEIADILNKDIKYVYNIIYRIKNKLKEML